MERSITELFVILALNPEKGRVSLNDIHFRHTLTGALIMDLLEQGEIKIENKRLVPSIKQNGNNLHDMIASIIMKSTKNRRISLWIRRLSFKSRIIFREIISCLEKEKLIRKERRKFLFLIPYYRYWFIDTSVRISLIELLRGILLYGKNPGKKELMLLSLVDVSRAYSTLSRERGESKILRKKNLEILEGDLMSSDIILTIRDVRKAIRASIAAASTAAHGSH
jgi:hypothetical protein